jgi:hypothetical protein
MLAVAFVRPHLIVGGSQPQASAGAEPGNLPAGAVQASAASPGFRPGVEALWRANPATW